MDSWFKFEWIFISWIVSLIIHHHSIKRSAISDAKDDLVDLLTTLSELKWIDSNDNNLYQEERYNTMVARVTWKLKQLNKLASCSLVDESKLTPIYNFDVESYVSNETSGKQKSELKFHLQERCDDIIDTIETNHFTKVLTSKYFMLWSIRHSCGGILLGFIIVYLFINIMSFFFS